MIFGENWFMAICPNRTRFSVRTNMPSVLGLDVRVEDVVNIHEMTDIPSSVFATVVGMCHEVKNIYYAIIL